MTHDIDCDYLIIGAGSAGCVLAARLTESSDRRVVLLEAGGDGRDPFLNVPGLNFRNSTIPKFNWNYFTEPDDLLNGRRVYTPRGKVLGGSSAINGMIYIRGDRRDYDDWRQMGCEGWSYEDVLPFFKLSEANERGADPWHGGNGPLRVSKGRPEPEICEAFLSAAAEAGHATHIDFNGESMEGFGHFDCTVHKGRRWSLAKAYLEPAMHRANLTVMTDAAVARIDMEAGAAVGATVVVGGKTLTLRADREVLLCAGAINSPQLLMLSGIGPADHLTDKGIAVKLDLPGVGSNLQDHAAYKLDYSCPKPVTAFSYMAPVKGARALAQYMLFKEGIFSHTALPTGGFFRSDDRRDVPDMQIHFFVGLAPEAGDKSADGRAKLLPSREGFSVLVNQARPESRGDVRLKSADPREPPLIDPRYFSVRSDLTALMNGVERTREIINAQALRPYVTEELRPGRDITGDRLEADILNRSSSALHPVGTCRMGSDPDAVVDTSLRLRGIDRLRVVDASVMPRLINGNTNAPTVMIAEKAASMITGIGPERAVETATNQRFRGLGDERQRRSAM